MPYLRACDTWKFAFLLLSAAFRQANKVADVLSNLAMDGCGWEGLRDPQAIPAPLYDQVLSQSLFLYLGCSKCLGCRQPKYLLLLLISMPAPIPVSLRDAGPHVVGW